MISGIVQLVNVVHSRGHQEHGVLAFLSGLLSMVAGLVMVARPGVTLAFLTLVVLFFFAISGIGKVIFAFQARPAQGWGFILFNGIITLLLALMIGRHWPLSGAWAIGTLLGVNLLFEGFGIIVLGGGVRAIAKEAEMEPAE